MDPGFFELKTAADLYKKLQVDFETAINNPLNSNAWFNFFVTAEHLPEWILKDSLKASQLRKSNPYLRICSHIANGGKHYQVRPKNHSSVGGTALNYIIGPGFTIDKEFILYPSESESRDLGFSVITVVELAREILKFYQFKIY